MGMFDWDQTVDAPENMETWLPEDENPEEWEVDREVDLSEVGLELAGLRERLDHVDTVLVDFTWD